MNTSTGAKARECPGNQPIPIQPGTFSEPTDQGDVHLLGSECEDCGQRMFPARRRCVRCFGPNLGELVLERDGTLVSLTVVRQAPPGYWGPTPYVLGMVELGDGLQVLTHLIGKPVDAWRTGDAVQSCALSLGLDSAGRCVGTSFAFRPTARNQT
jgi:uncharacterized OB-fold protein